MQPANTNAKSLGELLNREYMCSLFGIIKLFQVIFGLSCFIAVSTYHSGITNHTIVGASGWIQFVSIVSFIVSFTFFLIHLFKVDQGCPLTFPALFIELVFSAILTVFYFIAGVVAACYIFYGSTFFPHFAAATFFTWACFLLYLADAIILFFSWTKSSEGPHFNSQVAGPPA